MRQHLEQDECRRCQLLTRSIWLRALAKMVEAGQRTPEQVQVNGAVTAFAPLGALVGAFDPTTRPPFQLRAVHPDGSLAVTVRETDDGDLVAHVRTPDPTLAGRTVRVEILGEGEPITVEVLLKAQSEDGCTGQHVFSSFAELASRLGADCAVLAALTEAPPCIVREEPSMPQTTFSTSGVQVKIRCQDGSLSIAWTGRFVPFDGNSRVA
jgi:hypothetical protein